MYCNKCGNYIDETKSIKFCNKCGNDVSEVLKKVVDNKKEEFPEIFNKHFKDDFDLYTKKDVINSKLFGTGAEN